MPERKTYVLLSFLFAGKPERDAVVTQVHFDADQEAVWKRILFYEEVPARPPLLLRAFLPRPVRTEGSKTNVGSTVRCIYSTGEVVKRITAVEPPRHIEFEVIDQRLGIERCARTLTGSYHLQACPDGTDVELVTRFRAYLRPRALWRPIEAIFLRQLHNHILKNIRVTIPITSTKPALYPTITESLSPQRALPRGLACRISELRSHR